MSTWADKHIEQLKAGNTVEFRIAGKSMEPLLLPGQLFKLEPAFFGIGSNVSERSIVLVTTGISTYLHRIGAISNAGQISWYRIEGAKGNSNGWVTQDKIYGVLIEVSD